MPIRPIFALICIVALGGCSYSYDLLAVVIQGRLAFIVDPHSRSGADCINSIYVGTDSAARASPTAGDDRGLVANGVFWWKDYAVDACLNPFPILYGQHLIGQPFVYSSGSGGVEAKPLKVGVIYEVGTSGSGSGHGSGRFRILPNHRIENLPPRYDTAKMTTASNGS